MSETPFYFLSTPFVFCIFCFGLTNTLLAKYENKTINQSTRIIIQLTKNNQQTLSTMNTTHMLLSIGMWFSWVQTASGPEAERRLMTDHNSAGGECLKYQPLGAIQWTYRPLGCNWYIALSCEHLVHQQIIFGVKNNAETSFTRVLI